MDFYHYDYLSQALSKLERGHEKDLRDDLPGGDLILDGLADLRSGHLSVNALLVLVGAPRLRAAGLDVPEVKLAELPEHQLYAALVARDDLDPYSAYNALIADW